LFPPIDCNPLKGESNLFYLLTDAQNFIKCLVNSNCSKCVKIEWTNKCSSNWIKVIGIINPLGTRTVTTPTSSPASYIMSKIKGTQQRFVEWMNVYRHIKI
jgi:hypothetical protein